MGPKDGTQATELVSKHLCPLSHLSGSRYYLFIYFLYVWILFLACLCMHPRVSGLEWMGPGRVAHTLNCWVVSPAPLMCVCVGVSCLGGFCCLVLLCLKQGIKVIPLPQPFPCWSYGWGTTPSSRFSFTLLAQCPWFNASVTPQESRPVEYEESPARVILWGDEHI